MKHIRSYPNRLVCEVLEEVRKCSKTRNFSYLPGLVEEVQTLVNRMESKLQDNKDVRNARDVINEAKQELMDIRAEIKALQELKKVIK